jgi:hypothetical protein
LSSDTVSSDWLAGTVTSELPLSLLLQEKSSIAISVRNTIILVFFIFYPFALVRMVLYDSNIGLIHAGF